jgi:hypothetical protein
VWALAKRTGVACERGEIGQHCSEAVDGQTVVRARGFGLALGKMAGLLRQDNVYCAVGRHPTPTPLGAVELRTPPPVNLRGGLFIARRVWSQTQGAKEGGGRIVGTLTEAVRHLQVDERACRSELWLNPIGP